MIPLGKEHFHKLTDPLRNVSVNNLFARAVIENYIDGKAYVDDIQNPKTFYVVHPYGMSLLFGDYTNSDFNAKLKAYAFNLNKHRNKHEWMQAFPSGWDKVLAGLFGDCMVKSSDEGAAKEDKIELNTRVNFKFNPVKYQGYKQKLTPAKHKIIRTDKQIFENKRGSVIPCYFWNNADDFLSKGLGFSLFCDGQLASTAYSAFVIENKLEIGIETAEEFRGKGFAQHVCSSLIDYCLANKYEPVWACKRENTGSFNLAQKLGFEPTFELPFYRLAK